MIPILATIGVGKWGRNIIGTLEKIPEVNLKYLCANSPQSLAPYSDKYEKISDWRELLNKKELDAVLVATPAKTHAEIAGAFVERGIAVFVEKPMVLNVSEAETLRTLVHEKETVFMVGYQYVFNDYIGFIKKEIEAGSFGKIIAVISKQVLIPQSADIDVFSDAAPHPLSIFQYLFNPSRLSSTEGKIEPDSATVTATFKNAPTLNIDTLSFGGKKVRMLKVVGEKATAVLDETLETDKLAIIKNGKTTYPKIKAAPSLQNELEHFLGCLKNHTTPLTNIDFGYRITEWLETISKKLK